ncbi:MAG: M56 family metallopeptidase [Flavobacterium sp.]|nr:M56 family metallopeptidase [Flavobacterium sp.]
MEALYIYLIKSSGLIGLFYLGYHLMLRKETFFTTNRWFLLVGLFTSVALPLVVITKIIWVAPTPTAIDWSNVPMTTVVEEKTFEDYLPILIGVSYGMGIAILLGKFAFDFYSLNTVLRGKLIQRQADFKFIDIAENVAPFSYFNTIVYNSSLYNPSELESILEHEKVHSDQNHTIDVLISRLFCVVFWFNPFIWLYKKAILQNLEFIADSEASKKISDKKAYQITLLKITTQENCVAITNHFYQSLIKKRIVMLNKNQSKKWNSWKYTLILPALVGFILLFQIKTIAQEKKSPNETQTKGEIIITIDKNFSDEELKKQVELFKKEYNCDLIFSEIERNSDNEIIGITVNHNKNIYGNETYKQHSNNPINPFYIKGDLSGKVSIVNVAKNNKIEDVEKDVDSENDVVSITKEIFIDGAKVSKNDMDKLDPNEIESMDVIKNPSKQEIRIVTKKFNRTLLENEIYINDKKVDKKELLLLDQNTIDKMDVNKNEKTIRIITKHSNSIINGSDLPMPPTPPTPPVFKFKSPKPPVFPKAPTAPKGDPINGDKKEWKEFEAKMEAFNAKMKKLEPQMEAFDKQMEEFDKQMEPFNKEMEIFEKKMEVYEQQMQEYQSKLNKKK